MTHHDGLPGDHEADAEETAAVSVEPRSTAAPTTRHASDDDSVFPVDHGDGTMTDTDTAGEGGYVSSTDRGEDSPVPHAGA